MYVYNIMLIMLQPLFWLLFLYTQRYFSKHSIASPVKIRPFILFTSSNILPKKHENKSFQLPFRKNLPCDRM